jgi:hypothetical protein
VTTASGSESDAQVIASQDQRIAALEAGRWGTFSIIELEWLTNAVLPDDGSPQWSGATLPEQADAELDRRARLAVSAALASRARGTS